MSAEADLLRSAPGAHTADAQAPCRVLVVDDDPLVLERLMSLLERARFEVHGATSGTAALEILRAVPCQIVLTDWEMPDLDGPALCREIRERDVDNYTYVMLLTVRGRAADVVSGLSAGADDYLVKGASAAELLARVEVGRRIMRLERSLRASNAENRRLSLTDPLTGAYNRRYLMSNLPRELDRSRRYHHPLAVLSFDIDQFKRINDRFGHDAGDEVLCAFVARAGGCTRSSTDWIARCGGEEFMMVLPETGLAAAAVVAEKVRVAFANCPIRTSAGPLTATVSIGVTALETADEIANTPLVELLRAADRCLYVSKHRGRDRATSLAPSRAALLIAHTLPGSRHEIN